MVMLHVSSTTVFGSPTEKEESSEEEELSEEGY